MASRVLDFNKPRASADGFQPNTVVRLMGFKQFRASADGSPATAKTVGASMCSIFESLTGRQRMRIRWRPARSDLFGAAPGPRAMGTPPCCARPGVPVSDALDAKAFFDAKGQWADGTKFEP